MLDSCIFCFPFVCKFQLFISRIIFLLLFLFSFAISSFIFSFLFCFFLVIVFSQFLFFVISCWVLSCVLSVLSWFLPCFLSSLVADSPGLGANLVLLQSHLKVSSLWFCEPLPCLHHCHRVWCCLILDQPVLLLCALPYCLDRSHLTLLVSCQLSLINITHSASGSSLSQNCDSCLCN